MTRTGERKKEKIALCRYRNSVTFLQMARPYNAHDHAPNANECCPPIGKKLRVILHGTKHAGFSRSGLLGINAMAPPCHCNAVHIPSKILPCMRRTNEERSTHGTVKHKIARLQLASREGGVLHPLAAVH